MILRTIACIVWWICSIPVRVFVCGVALPFILLAIPFWFLFDLKKYGCDGMCMPHPTDWAFFDIPKCIYWNFLILGELDL